MIINIYVGSKKLDKLLKLQKMANETLQELLTKVQGLEANADAVNTSLTNIAGDITRIKESLPAEGGLTAEEVATLKTALEGAEAKISALATSADTLDKENEPPIV